MNRFISATFLDSVLGVPSTLLFIFWAGFIFSMPNSELGAIPACLTGKKRCITNLNGKSHSGLKQLIRGHCGVSLTGGVVGHICSHRIWSWPSLVHHTVHAVHARSIRRACSHHALRHVRIAWWPREESAWFKLADKSRSLNEYSDQLLE